MRATEGSDTGPAAGERGQLFNLSYRLLGSLADSEDAVQEAYTRWYALPLDPAGRDRLARGLADDGHRPHLPGRAALGTGPA